MHRTPATTSALTATVHPASRFGLYGASVCATLVAVGAPVPASLLASMRAIDAALALSQVKSVCVARYLGDDSEAARHAIVKVWQALRPYLLGCAAPLPRISTR